MLSLVLAQELSSSLSREGPATLKVWALGSDLSEEAASGAVYLSDQSVPFIRGSDRLEEEG